MPCLDENQVLDYLQGRTQEAPRQIVEEHLDGCAACRALVSGVVRVTAAEERSRRALAPGATVDHYQVMRLIGQGATGEVYLCRDTRLGRRAALKVIRAELVRSPETRGRFLREAQAIARLNHPHIVTIYGVGEWRGMLYLALEHLEGEPLRQRMDEERLSIREITRLGLAIAEALREAHRNGVLHLDLKPANVLLPRDGRLRVVDFGLSRVLPEAALGPDALDTTLWGSAVAEQSSGSGGGRLIHGTPAYMAPEQWRGESCGEAADLWGLGVILYELIAERRPYAEASFAALHDRVVGPEPVPPLVPSEPVPEPLLELVARCLDKDPTRRPTASQAAASLEGMLSSGRPRSPDQTPFRGLQPFSERHAELFFGREPEVAAFLERMRDQGVLPVVGPSGAGKTSFVQAGVIPRLREQASWLVLQLRPGEAPFAALAARLLRGDRLSRSESRSGLRRLPREATSEEAHLAEELAASPARLALALRERASLEHCRVLLFVDQLEELCTLASAADRAAFLEALCAAGDDPDDPVRVVFTLRDDFLGQLAVSPPVREALGQLTLLRSPEPEALEQALRGPLSVVDYHWDDESLPAQIVDEVCGEPAALALLQFTLQLVWDRRDIQRRMLLSSAYRAIGGVGGALARHADTLLEGLAEPEVRLARQILLRLVTPSGTRRELGRSALLAGLPDGAAVLDRLVAGRLVALRRSFEIAAPGVGADPAAADPEEDPHLELAHESLVSSWRRLARWIEESREQLAFLDEVGQAAAIWERHGRPAEEVWRGDPLQEALHRADRSSATLPEPVVAFLEAGRRREALAGRRRRRAQLLTVAALTLIALGSATMALLLGRERRLAATERDHARLQRATAELEGARSALAGGDPLQAWAKLRTSLEIRDSPLARSLHAELERAPLLWHRQLGGNLYDAALSPDGTLAAAACQNGSVYLIDVRTAAIRVLRGHQDQVFAVAFSPDGRRLASGAWDGEVRLWDLTSGAVRALGRHRAAVWRLAFSPDGRRLASASWDTTLRLWDLVGGAEPRTLRGHRDRVYGVAFSPDGRSIASASVDRTVRLWSAEGAPLRVLEGHTDRVYAVAWSPDGTLLASSGLDRSVRLWRPATGALLRGVGDPDKGVYGIAFAPDGRRLAASGFGDHSIRLWDVASGRRTLRLSGHDERVYAVGFGRDGQHLISAAGKSVRLWRLTAPEARSAAHRGVVWGVAFSPDGQTIASGGLDRTIRLWDVREGTTRRVLEGHGAIVTGLSFRPSGGELASASADGSILLWDLVADRPPRKLLGHGAAVYGVAHRPGGALLASAGSDRTVRLWTLPDGAAAGVLRGHTDVVWNVAFSPDGLLLASASEDRSVRLWRTDQIEAPPRIIAHDAAVFGIAFTPDGQALISGSADGVVRRWDLRTRVARVIGRTRGRVYYLAVDPRGELVGAPGSKGSVRLWRIADGSSSDLRGHSDEVNSLRFSPDGAACATAGDDGTVRLWNTRSGEPLWRTVLALDPPGAFLTGRGWSAAPLAAWQRALERSGWLASSRGTSVCALVAPARLELWDRSTDRRLFSVGAEGAEEVVALDRGCVVRGSASLLLYGVDGSFRQLRPRAVALAPDGPGFLAAGEAELTAFDASGALRERRAIGVGVTAVGRVGQALAIGYREGTVELLTPDGRRLPFENLPTLPVVALRAGPKGTLAAGFASGAWGLWSTEDGKRLLSDQLHGPVSGLQVVGTTLRVSSALGGVEDVSLDVFGVPHCALLRQVWSRVPVAWEDGALVLRARPPAHPCR